MKITFIRRIARRINFRPLVRNIQQKLRNLRTIDKTELERGRKTQSASMQAI